MAAKSDLEIAAEIMDDLMERGATFTLIGIEDYVRIGLDAVPFMTNEEAQDTADRVLIFRDEFRLLLQAKRTRQ